MTTIIQQRIKQRTEAILSETQAGFRQGRGTTDHPFTFRQLTEKYVEKGRQLSWQNNKTPESSLQHLNLLIQPLQILTDNTWFPCIL